MKGITPVIAVVLLLLITVGAVGAAFGLFQQLRDQAQGQQDQFVDAQRASNTDIQYDIVLEAPGDASSVAEETINFTIRNTGQRGIGLSNELSLQFRPAQESQPLPPETFKDLYGDEWLGGSGDEGRDVNECFENADESLGQGDTFECSTNVSFPELGEQITIVTNYDATQLSFPYTCRPSTTGSTC